MVKNPKYIPNVTSPLEEPIYTWENFEDKINYKEIKSLGFEKAGFRFINKPHHKIDVTIFRKRKDSEFYYSLVVDNINHKIDISIQQFDSGYSKRLFYGKIENKKELETLMKQLEIISIEKGEPKR